MITDQKGAQTDQKPPRFYAKTQQAVDLIVKHGVEEKTALELAGCKTQMSNGNLSRFREKVRKYELTAPQLVKKARNRIRDCIDMKPLEVERQTVTKEGAVISYTEKIYPSHTVSLAASGMVIDRDQPQVRQSLNVNVNADVSPVDLNKYLNR